MIVKKNILAICGSTRKHSANRDIINVIAKLSEDSLSITIFEGLIDLPYFNQDISEENMPVSVIAFKEAISKADGVLICTPEYVFSLPGVLKNAFEWMVSSTVFLDKPSVLITASSSGEKAHESLLLVMKTLGVKTNDDLCLLISGVKSKLNSKGKVVDEALILKLNTVCKELMGTVL
jgi:chromate reductase